MTNGSVSLATNHRTYSAEEVDKLLENYVRSEPVVSDIERMKSVREELVGLSERRTHTSSPIPLDHSDRTFIKSVGVEAYARLHSDATRTLAARDLYRLLETLLEDYECIPVVKERLDALREADCLAIDILRLVKL